MELMKDIINLAKGLPYLQQLVIKGVLANEDFDDKKLDELVELAISDKNNQEIVLEDMDILENSEEGDSVALVSISELKNINNLFDKGVSFSETGITVIYGENGTGKSGYSRILKKCCRSRDKKCEILKNVYDKTDIPQSAKIYYKEGGQEHFYKWTPLSSDMSNELQRVHVFDKISADVYLSGENDIEYRPFGMDVIDKTAVVMKQIKILVQSRIDKIQFNQFGWTEKYNSETKATKLLENLAAKNAEAELNNLIKFNDDEDGIMKNLRDSIPIREKSSPQKEQERLLQRNTSLEKVYNYLTQLLDSCSAKSINSINSAIKELLAAEKAANDAEKLSFDDERFLSGTGNDAWKVLWAAAKAFAEDFAYKGRSYPPSDVGNTKCVLCQQELNDVQINQMKTFSDYVLDKSQQNLVDKRHALETCSNQISNKMKSDDDDIILIDSIKDIYPDLYKNLFEMTSSLKGIIRTVIMESILNKKRIYKKNISTKSIETRINTIKAIINENKINLRKPLDDKEYTKRLNIDRLQLAGLESRKELLRDKKLVVENINNYDISRRYEEVIGWCDTTKLSKKSSDLSQKYIVAILEEKFDEEIKAITDNKFGAKLVKAGTVQGVNHSKIVLTDKKGVVFSNNIAKVLSDGELRSASIAGFLAELSMDNDRSALIFDDPISSLDHIYSQAVAARICKESRKRQIIIFTHDMLFLTQLINISEDKNNGVTLDLKTIRSGNCTGVVEDDVPPEKMPIKKRLGILKETINLKLEPLYNGNKLKDYQERGEAFYKELRKAWERFVEEVLFCGVVTRFDNAVHTQQLKGVKIDEADIQTVMSAMTNCSSFMHDQPDIVTATVGNPESLRNDLKDLEDLVNLKRSKQA